MCMSLGKENYKCYYVFPPKLNTFHLTLNIFMFILNTQKEGERTDKNAASNHSFLPHELIRLSQQFAHNIQVFQ